MLTEQEILNKVYRYCALQERSPAEIRRKVIKLGGEEAMVKGIIGHLLHEKLLDEERFAMLFVQGKMNSRKWGEVKMADALRSHGISEKIIADCLQRLVREAYTEMMMHELLKKWKTLKDEDGKVKKMKLIRFGQQRGYNIGHIMSCLKQPEFSE